MVPAAIKNNGKIECIGPSKEKLNGNAKQPHPKLAFNKCIIV